jgi:tetratricopeptide (TPR) repeat protein
MRKRRLRLRSQTTSHRVDSTRWWNEGYPDRRSENLPGARRFRARRRQLLPVETQGSPSWWPLCRRGIVVLAIIAPILTIRFGADWKTEYAAWKAKQQTAHIVERIDEAANSEVILQLVPLLQQHPTQPEVVRKLAWAASENHPHQAITLFYRLQDLDQATFEDQLQLGRLLVKTDRTVLGQEIFSRLMQEHPTAHEPWLECGHAALHAGDTVKAEAAYQQALNLKPDAAEVLIALSQMLQGSQPTGAGAPCTDALMALAEKAAKEGDVEAFSEITLALSELPQLSTSQKARFLALTNANPACPIEVRLARHGMEAPLQLSDEERGSLHHQWAAQLDRVDGPTRSRGLRWIQNLGDHAFVLAHTDRAAVYEQGAELTVRLLSLLSTQRIDAASRLMAHPKATFAKLHPQILAAFDAFRTQTPTTLGPVLNRLFQETDPALHNAQACYVIGSLALNTGTPDLALSAFTRALEMEPHWALPAEPLLLAARKSGRDSSQVLEGLRKLSRLPSSVALRKRIAYLKLLANDSLASTETEVSALLTGFPGDPFLRMLAAFGRYKQSDFATAVKGLIPLPNHQWHQGEAAVIVSIMASGGLLDQTLPLVTAIKKNNLFREEKELVTPWIDALAQQGRFDPAFLASSPPNR